MLLRLFRRILRRPQELDILKKQGLKIGENFRCHSPYAFDSLFPWLITVGNNVCISANVRILAHDTSAEYVNQHTKIGIVEIGNNVYIGYGATILCNVRVGDNAIIGAGSVVTKDVPANTVYAGNPAKFICSIQEYKIKHETYLKNTPVYMGPVAKWHNFSLKEKEAMRHELKKSHGYMK